ncbi:Serine/threonine-protein kinase [Fulvia fulva]|uniref:Serine/threonine-protein kinase n=1 Tax=Passalora fulva TaxID=5499 RepID=A0A9Q8URD5_PASFU|nr:Serine/threonine-protein kinase [Fulvia fulva]KAK4619975.1 Serine/threonine-protein kinase [Fulvia fulva]KAK4620917.1 Serine/threonine-protein kinase [Fulvia fulva]UJO19643.1 Serine/threonine-protein kinase [Fulvia fulva]WPV17681.1 Serine/threonine-protein kinase [Fulvia fulva]WPV32113.1 Serine/threonine-protein kinase [Fulvia fulva]
MMPGMDIEISSGHALEIQQSPPTRISSPRPREVPAEADRMPIPKLDHEALREKAKKRRKNKKKGMQPAAPAVNVIKGFQTPVTSGGEESDASTNGTPRFGAARMQDFSSVASSPALRPATPGNISALKARLDALDLDEHAKMPSLARVMSSKSDCDSGLATPSSRGSDGDKTEMEAYDVPLDQDFISPEAGSVTPLYASQAIEGGLRTASIHRKMQADDFKPLRCLGKGAFGTVHLVRQQASGRLYAQKQFKKASLTVHKRLIEQTRTERTILESVNRHPFVVKLFYAFQDQEKLYLILEYAQGGELFTHLAMERMFSEDVAAFYLAEMVLALEHLHHNVRVIYRDLKPENCLLDAEGHLLLTDFGLSKVALDDDEDGSRANSFLGTIEYMAPEVIEGKGYDFSVDWWGLGAIACDLLTGKPPFGGGNHTKIQQNILKQKLQLPYFIGPDAKDFLTRLLRKEPHKRLGGASSKDVKALKAHRFFRKIDWKKLERREVEPPIQPVVTDPELAENFSSDFTDLPLSPVVTRGSKPFDDDGDDPYVAAESNPFGGFSFVASKSLLDDDQFMLDA